MQRDHSWSSTHPRHRLLDALFGFQSYYERQQAELERFRGLYKHVSKKHKTVRNRTNFFLFFFGSIHS